MIAIIAAIGRNRVMGSKNGLPWHVPEEIELFRSTVAGSTTIMGGTTYELMKKSLPGAHNIVLTRSNTSLEGADVASTIEDAISKAKSYGKDIFIIGGASIFAQTIGIADKMYLSYIKGSFEGDVFFPDFDPSKWKIESTKDLGDFERVVYARN